MLWFTDISFMLSNKFENLELIVILRFLIVYKSSSYGSINRKKNQTFSLTQEECHLQWHAHNISNANLMTTAAKSIQRETGQHQGEDGGTGRFQVQLKGHLDTYCYPLSSQSPCHSEGWWNCRPWQSRLSHDFLPPSFLPSSAHFFSRLVWYVMFIFPTTFSSSLLSSHTHT